MFICETSSLFKANSEGVALSEKHTLEFVPRNFIVDHTALGQTELAFHVEQKWLLFTSDACIKVFASAADVGDDPLHNFSGIEHFLEDFIDPLGGGKCLPVINN